MLVAVSDTKTGESFAIEVGTDQSALDVFHHPFAYAGSRRSRQGDHGRARAGDRVMTKILRRFRRGLRRRYEPDVRVAFA